MIITTSWDDGHILDLRLADLLDKYDLLGTFYIARKYLDERMSDNQMVELSQRHELGAHTLNHSTLTQIDDATAQQEIVGSKSWLEDTLGQVVTSFCYPKGMYTSAHCSMVKDADYRLARTAIPYRFKLGDDPFSMPTTLHIYPFPLRPLKSIRGIRTRLQPIRRLMPHRKRVNVPLTALKGWIPLATALLQEAQRVDGVWHLWGHSWEIEKYDMWSDLEQVLAIASSYQAQALTNTQVIQLQQESEDG